MGGTAASSPISQTETPNEKQVRDMSEDIVVTTKVCLLFLRFVCRVFCFLTLFAVFVFFGALFLEE